MDVGEDRMRAAPHDGMSVDAWVVIDTLRTSRRPLRVAPAVVKELVDRGLAERRPDGLLQATRDGCRLMLHMHHTPGRRH